MTTFAANVSKCLPGQVEQNTGALAVEVTAQAGLEQLDGGIEGQLSQSSTCQVHRGLRHLEEALGSCRNLLHLHRGDPIFKKGLCTSFRMIEKNEH